MLKELAKKYLRPALRSCGYDFVKYAELPTYNGTLYSSLRHYLSGSDLMIFDVGANLGQTGHDFRIEFPLATIHSFEPGPDTFKQLQLVAQNDKFSAWNLAMGSSPGTLTFYENEISQMSSFLPMGERGWGTIKKETPVTVGTIDLFCAEHQIERIDILKSDTQGYDLEVFKGARAMMEKGKIGMIYFEVIFSEIYKNTPPYEETFHYLEQNGFKLEQLFGINHANGAIWTDALFVHQQLHKK